MVGNVILCGFYCASSGAVSSLPTFAGKRLKLPVESVLPVLAGIGLLGAAVVTEPWFTYMAVVVIYTLSLPLSTWQFLRERRQYEGSKIS